MSVRSEILLWAQRLLAKKEDDPRQILELTPEAGLDAAQAAFHKIARFAHPDLHRASLTPEELELVTSAYSKVAGAYQDIRATRQQTTRVRPMREAPLKTDPPPPSQTAPTASGSGQMSSKALVHYRKAELSLRRGDLRGAVLQLKMAIAADPLSAFLRTALGEVEAEVRKPT
ncbi:MAG: hypothetical protein ABI867_35255 [Kofleriaceae bacterium]